MKFRTILKDNKLLVAIEGEINAAIMLKLKKQIQDLFQEDFREATFDIRGVAGEARDKLTTFLMFCKESSVDNRSIVVLGAEGASANGFSGLKQSSSRV